MTRVLDELLPAPDVAERHERLVPASPDRVHAAVRELTLREVPVVAVLAAVRSVPELVVRRGRGLRTGVGRPLVQQALDAGFTVLHDEPADELVLGLIGQPWRPGGRVVRAGRAEFSTFAEPGFVRAAMSVVLTATDGGTRVVTETRVLATDPGARAAFARYWRVVGPFSGLIRVVLLRGLAGRAGRPPAGRA
jgi:hypothetical protein